MAGPIPEQSNYGSFVETTNVWDVSPIVEMENLDEPMQDLLVRLYQNINIIAEQLNGKDTGIFTEDEFLTNKLFFPTSTSNTKNQSASQDYRPVFRKVIDFGMLPNATSKSVAHGIIADAIMTSISCTANNTGFTSKIPIPYASPTALNENISLEITDTHVIIKTGIDRRSYTTCYIVLEFIKQ